MDNYDLDDISDFDSDDDKNEIFNFTEITKKYMMDKKKQVTTEMIIEKMISKENNKKPIEKYQENIKDIFVELLENIIENDC
jgi:hypothetical protein